MSGRRVRKGRRRLVGRGGVLVLVSAFFYIGSVMLVNPLIAGYAESLGVTVAMTGVIAALMNGCALVFRPIAGSLADRVSKPGLAIAGAVLMCGSGVGYALATGPMAVAVLRVVNGVGYSVCSVCVSTWFSELVPPERIGAGMGVFGLMNALAMAVAPSVGLAVYGAVGYRAAIGVSGLLAGLSLAAMVGAVLAGDAYGAGCSGSARGDGDACERGREPGLAADGGGTRERGLGALFSLRAIPAAVEIALFTIPYCAVQSYLVQYVEARGLGMTVGLFFPVYAVALLALRSGLRNAFDRYPFWAFALASALCEVASLVLLGSMRGDAGLLVAALCMAGGYGVMCSVCQSTSVRLAGKGHAGRANATYYVGLDIGMMLGPALGGLLFGAVEPAWLFPVFVAFPLVAGALGRGRWLREE